MPSILDCNAGGRRMIMVDGSTMLRGSRAFFRLCYGVPFSRFGCGWPVCICWHPSSTYLAFSPSFLILTSIFGVIRLILFCAPVICTISVFKARLQAGPRRLAVLRNLFPLYSDMAISISYLTADGEAYFSSSSSRYTWPTHH
jgi:hypothetical protein